MFKDTAMETRVKQEFRYPLEYAGEDIRKWCPSMLNRLTAREVCEIDRGNVDSIYEIISDCGISQEAYSAFAVSEMEKDGYDVFHTETYRDGEEIIVICHAIKYERHAPDFNVLSLN